MKESNMTETRSVPVILYNSAQKKCTLVVRRIINNVARQKRVVRASVNMWFHIISYVSACVVRGRVVQLFTMHLYMRRTYVD